jgi:hypothetical protein
MIDRILRRAFRGTQNGHVLHGGIVVGVPRHMVQGISEEVDIAPLAWEPNPPWTELPPNTGSEVLLRGTEGFREGPKSLLPGQDPCHSNAATSNPETLIRTSPFAEGGYCPELKATMAALLAPPEWPKRVRFSGSPP